MRFAPIIILLLFVIETCFGVTNRHIVSARLESCSGCSLNKLPDVRQFFYEDVPTYENVEWKKIPGAAPIVIFLNLHGEEIERYSLSNLSRNQCNMLMESRGFESSRNEEEEL